MSNRYWTEFSDRKITAPVPPKDKQPSGGVSYVEKTKAWGSKDYGSPGPKRNTVGFKEVKAYPVQHLADDSGLKPAKAKKMLHEGTAQGHEITEKQRRYFGWVAGGRKPRKATKIG